MIASVPRLPSPGIAKMVSTMNEPLISVGKAMPSEVMMGRDEFLKACFQTTVFSSRPLARAVLM